VAILETFRETWTAQIQLVLFFTILAALIYNLVMLIGALRALGEAENPINAHLIGPVYERYANFPKTLRALALIALMVGLLGWAAVAYNALSAAASLPGAVQARDLCGALATASFILATGAFNATIAYASYCIFSGILALRYSRSIHKLASRKGA